MKTKLLFLSLFMASVMVNAQNDFYFTSIETTGASQNIDFEKTSASPDGFGDHSDVNAIINPDVDDASSIFFNLEFNQDAWVKIDIQVPVIGSLNIYNSGEIVASPVSATSPLLSALSAAPDGEYLLTIYGSTEGEPSSTPDATNSNNEVLQFTVVIDRTLSTITSDFQDFTYYPNPIQNQLNFKAKSEIEKIELYNVLGQKVIDQSPQQKSLTADTSGLKAGIYIMKVQINGNQQSFKIIKR